MEWLAKAIVVEIRHDNGSYVMDLFSYNGAIPDGLKIMLNGQDLFECEKDAKMSMEVPTDRIQGTVDKIVSVLKEFAADDLKEQHLRAIN